MINNLREALKNKPKGLKVAKEVQMADRLYRLDGH